MHDNASDNRTGSYMLVIGKNNSNSEFGRFANYTIHMSFKIRPSGSTALPLMPRHQRLGLAFFIGAVWAMIFLSLHPSAVQAHPIEFHSQPLDAETIERVIKSLDGLVSEVEANGSVDSIDLPSGYLSVTAMMWSLQRAVMAIDESDNIDSPILRQAALSAGYEASPYAVEEWQAEAQQVLETYQVIHQGLDNTKLQARYATFNQEFPSLDPERAIEIESALIRDAELLRTTAKDRPLVKQYQSQLQALVVRMGIAWQ